MSKNNGNGDRDLSLVWCMLQATATPAYYRGQTSGYMIELKQAQTSQGRKLTLLTAFDPEGKLHASMRILDPVRNGPSGEIFNDRFTWLDATPAHLQERSTPTP